MLEDLRLVLGTIARHFCTRRSLLLENLALRQQLAVFKRRHARPKLNLLDKPFWIAARQIWSDWKQSLVIALPDTVVQWHRAGFKLYWRVLSKVRRPRGGRRRISREARDLIFKMVAENPTWGAPRIHAELLLLGFDVSERTISRWMRKAPRDPEPAKRWLAFLRNHREAIAAMDFFTVPTLTFSVFYCLFIISHDRRRVLHFNVTRHPTSEWIVQQLREAFPCDSTVKFLVFDRDAKVWIGSSISTSVDEDPCCPNLIWKPLAKRNRRGVGSCPSPGSGSPPRDRTAAIWWPASSVRPRGVVKRRSAENSLGFTGSG
jgi:putative transposase